MKRLTNFIFEIVFYLSRDFICLSLSDCCKQGLSIVNAQVRLYLSLSFRLLIRQLRLIHLCRWILAKRSLIQLINVTMKTLQLFCLRDIVVRCVFVVIIITPNSLIAQHDLQTDEHSYCAELPAGSGLEAGEVGFVDRFNYPWRPSAHLVAEQKNDVRTQAVHCGNFRLDFEDVLLNNNIGFDDPTPVNHRVLGLTTIGEVRQQTVCEVFNYLGSLINIQGSPDVIIRESRTIPVGFLAGASPFFAGGVSGIVGGTMYDHITSGIDPTPSSGDYDAFIIFNFGYDLHEDWSTSPGSKFDLYSIALHEIIHTLGFMSLIDSDGMSRLGSGYSRYDKMLINRMNQRLVDPGSSQFIGSVSDLLSDAITFRSEGCDYANPVFSPSQYRPGSSLSHFDEYRSGVRYVMRWATGGGSDRELTVSELQVLCDLGYEMRNDICKGCAPFGTEDYSSTSPGEIVCIDVLSNDRSSDGRALQIDPSSLRVEFGGGTVSIVGGQLCYTPPSSFIGVAKLVYCPSDGSKTGDETWVYVNVVEHYIFSACDRDVLNVSTGWDHDRGEAIPLGSPNIYWLLIDDPEASTVEPRVTYAIGVYRGWADHLPGSRWIADRRSGVNSANGDYIYELRFCLSEIPESLRLVIDVLIDDLGYVEVNGTEVGRTRSGYAFRAPALHIDEEIGKLVTIGENRLTVVAQNGGAVAAGFDVAGHIIGSKEGVFRCNSVEVGSDVELCLGESAELLASGGASYRWSPGDGLSCTDCADPVVTPQSSRTYRVQVLDAQGCVTEDSVRVKVREVAVDVSPDITICLNSEVKLKASGGVSYEWEPSRGLSCSDCPNPIASPARSTTYRVLVTDTNGCLGIDSVHVTVDSVDVESSPDVAICAGDSVEIWGERWSKL